MIGKVERRLLSEAPGEPFDDRRILEFRTFFFRHERLRQSGVAAIPTAISRKQPGMEVDGFGKAFDVCKNL